MPQVPKYERETRLNSSALPYQHANVNGDAFGSNIANAGMNVSNSFNQLANAAMRANDIVEDAKMLELSNIIDQWEQDNLYDKDKGYYYKSGKDAVGKSSDVIKNYDDYIEKYKSENRMTPFNQKRVDAMVAHKKSRISYGVNAHDFKETGNWAKIEGQKGIDNSINGMVHSRNNPDDMNVQLNNGLKIVEWQGMMQKLDKDTINAMKKDYKSKAHEAVLNAYISEGSLQAGEYFNKHKEELRPEMQARYIGAIQNEEQKYQSRNLADSIISSAASEEEAVKLAESIDNIELSDMVVSRVKSHFNNERHYKDLAEKDALNNFYNTAIQKQQNGEVLSYDDIPDNLDPQTKFSLMNYVNKNGQQDSDTEVWEKLYNMKVNNAQGFAEENLLKYRGFLSESEYKQFTKDQEAIKKGDYFTVIQDDNVLIKQALKTLKLDSGKKEDVAYSELRAMTREYEARKGRKINDTELINFANSLGFKGEKDVALYKLYEKGMAEKVGFMKSIVNDFVYYQSQHNGELPSDEEKYKIVQKRVMQKAQENKNFAQQSIDKYKYNAQTLKNIAYVTPKPNEQKVLTYFADKQVISIGSQLGLKLTVTDRYRNQPGSKHSEGRAADVSMSEHRQADRIRIYEKMLALPTVYKIGTSDPAILTHFKGNNKIVDERLYDKKHGTNHVNHAHVTLINYNPAKPVTDIASNNRSVYKF